MSNELLRRTLALRTRLVADGAIEDAKVRSIRARRVKAGARSMSNGASDFLSHHFSKR